MFTNADIALELKKVMTDYLQLHDAESRLSTLKQADYIRLTRGDLLDLWRRVIPVLKEKCREKVAAAALEEDREGLLDRRTKVRNDLAVTEAKIRSEKVALAQFRNDLQKSDAKARQMASQALTNDMHCAQVTARAAHLRQLILNSERAVEDLETTSDRFTRWLDSGTTECFSVISHAVTGRPTLDSECLRQVRSLVTMFSREHKTRLAGSPVLQLRDTIRRSSPEMQVALQQLYDSFSPNWFMECILAYQKECRDSIRSVISTTAETTSFPRQDSSHSDLRRHIQKRRREIFEAFILHARCQNQIEQLKASICASIRNAQSHFSSSSGISKDWLESRVEKVRLQHKLDRLKLRISDMARSTALRNQLLLDLREQVATAMNSKNAALRNKSLLMELVVENSKFGDELLKMFSELQISTMASVERQLSFACDLVDCLPGILSNEQAALLQVPPHYLHKHPCSQCEICGYLEAPGAKAVDLVSQCVPNLGEKNVFSSVQSVLRLLQDRCSKASIQSWTGRRLEVVCSRAEADYVADHLAITDLNVHWSKCLEDLESFLLPRLEAALHGTESRRVLREAAEQALETWWEQPGQHAATLRKVGGLTLTEWIAHLTAHLAKVSDSQKPIY